MKPRSDIDTSQVEGNASSEIKHRLLSGLQSMRSSRISQSTGKPFGGFEAELVSRLRLTEASISSKTEEPEKLEGRVVFQVIVDEEMLNGAENMHGGCSAMMIDICSTMPIYVLGASTRGHGIFGVSQSLNIVYHSPALSGDKLRVVSTTLAVGGRALSSRCEIWNVTRHRLVASAVHIKMVPSEPKVSESAKL
ncbi:HotDog domain-containing protein [Suillus subaureus]|uniref:HotDog domain-containing protein n=1 Tax=Suillus subaureus TaxID=48587 RepID=A0A9P7ANJ3_9AGAM|nr:HotDog domain-containing protein [Suillus subaureus]XP_041186188.1 HotDog domain-containing protein [Suillus subaureus]KAG1792116.1 HotDog domain-containing protein [Suillus subaureus]KAG1801942.1 HotDog domain-containing protein [Suillus subaureus]